MYKAITKNGIVISTIEKSENGLDKLHETINFYCLKVTSKSLLLYCVNDFVVKIPIESLKFDVSNFYKNIVYYTMPNKK